MSFRFAPAAVVRGCAWPLEALDAFGQDIDRERDALWERTVGDRRFLQALAFASPSFAVRAASLVTRRRERNKRVRHAETSLYRYLARAASRTTPAGLWAGVTLATMGRETRVTRRAPRHALAPDLAPFASIVRALGERSPYRDLARWRLNPTLRGDPSGSSFGFAVRLADGSLQRRALDASPGLDLLVDRLATLGARPLGELAADAGSSRATMDALADAGALVGGFALPTTFASAWEALDATAERLLGEDRTQVRAAIDRLRVIAEDLARGLDALEAIDVARAQEQARSVIRDLSAKLDVHVADASEVVLNCDLGLPFDIVLAEDGLAATLDAYHREWLGGASPVSGARAERRSALVDALQEQSLLLGDPLPRGLSAESDPSSLRALVPSTTANADLAVRAESLAPWGSLVGRLGRDRLALVFGVDDNPARAFARYGDLLGNDHALVEWLASRISDLRRDHGVITADLAVPFDHGPNVLARPSVGALRIEPWSADGPDLLGAELRADGRSLVWRVAGVGRLSVLSLSSAELLASDSVAEQLLFTGFYERVGASFRASSLLAQGEDDAPVHAPPFRLSTGEVLRAARTCISGEHLASLLASRGRDRFARFEALARRLDWPRAVTISIDGGTPLYIDTTSPLALEAAFEGAAGARIVVVEDAHLEASLEGPHGKHVTDVTIPFARARHAFSCLENF